MSKHPILDQLRNMDPPPLPPSKPFPYSPKPDSEWLGDFFTFRTMLTPILVRILFAVGFFVAPLACLVALANGGTVLVFPLALFALIGLRVACETAIVLFSIHEELRKK